MYLPTSLLRFYEWKHHIYNICIAMFYSKHNYVETNSSYCDI